LSGCKFLGINRLRQAATYACGAEELIARRAYGSVLRMAVRYYGLKHEGRLISSRIQDSEYKSGYTPVNDVHLSR